MSGPQLESARAVRRGEELQALATLTAAFAQDPVARWVWPERSTYAWAFPGFAQAFGGRAFEHGTADCAERAIGAALWLPPGVESDGPALERVLDESVPASRGGAVGELLEAMGRFHPSEAHWYLPLIGVLPAFHGRGVGSQLLRHALERCDRDVLPAYLEASSPSNRPLYERHGFEVVGELRAADCPPLWPMRREPR